ncbi:hypothetical protein AgCh_025892 [Apium graveolens]
MQAQGVWLAVEPTDLKATVEEKTDKVALTMIYQGIPEQMLLSIGDEKTAKGAWDALKTMYLDAEKVKKAKIQTLKAQLESLSMQDSEQLEDFSMKLNGLITSTLEQFGDLEIMSVEEAIGLLRIHEERMKGKGETVGGQLTKEEREKRENEDGKLLLTREEWLKRQNIGSADAATNTRNHGIRDKRRVSSFNFYGYGHFATECKKSKRGKDTKPEMNMAHVDDDEPALLLAQHKKNERDLMLVNEEKVIPSLLLRGTGKQVESNVWYLDNGASNYMMGCRSKFTRLDEGVSDQIKFGDGSSVKIEGKSSVVFECNNGEEHVLKEYMGGSMGRATSVKFESFCKEQAVGTFTRGTEMK